MKTGSGLYETYPSEGGHTDFTPKTDEDYELVKFARNYIQNSKNVENLRGSGKVGRLSVERVCAGPAVPMIYAFMKEKHPDLEVVLEKDTPLGKAKHFDDLVAADIIKLAMKHNDPLCMKVVEKFTDIFGTEAGNVALKMMPHGGIYLIGGVTQGIRDYLIKNNRFIDNFYDKGRLSDVMRYFKVMLVNADIEIGLVGAQEKARREIIKMNEG